MILRKTFTGLAGIVLMAGISGSVMAESAMGAKCGNPPAQPELPKGAKATMDDLVAGSQAVKTYIAEADVYLDCEEARASNGEVESMSKSDKKEWAKNRSQVLKARNDIADKFNKEVAAYKKANP